MRSPDWATEDGRVKLYCGDARDVIESVGAFDSAVTDPPYGVNRSQNGMRRQDGHKRSTDYESGFDDTPEYISSVVVSVVNKCRDIARCVAVTPGFANLRAYDKPDHIGGYYYQGQSTVTAWGAAWWQPVLFYGKDPHVGRLQRDMFIGRSGGDDVGHPCPKRLDDWTLLVERASRPDWIVIDPFMGSGTTGVACLRTGRKFIGIELGRRYFRIAIDRIRSELERAPLFEKKPTYVTQQLFGTEPNE